MLIGAQGTKTRAKTGRSKPNQYFMRKLSISGTVKWSSLVCCEVLFWCPHSVFLLNLFLPMRTLNDVHQQFAEYFNIPALKPYLYALSRKMSEGHICIGMNNVDTTDMPEPYINLLQKEKALSSRLLGTAKQDNHPFIVHQERLYLQRYFRYETQLLRKIQELVRKGKIEEEERKTALTGQKELVQQLFHNDNATDTDWQLAAALTAVLQNFTIITGGPGTGKTTTVAKILAIRYTLQPELRVVLAAPTGKAGARMAESLIHSPIAISDTLRQQFNSLKPATIHRLLGWQKGSPYFRHHAGHPIPADLVIVDESSMIDVALFAKLMDAIGPDTRIILLGDKDQLASVEAGSLFGDLCRAQDTLNTFSEDRLAYINSFIKNEARRLTTTGNSVMQHHPLFQQVVELRYSHRFKGDEGIGKISRAVIANDIPALLDFLQTNNDNTVFIDEQYETQVLEQFIKGFEDYIKEEDIKTALDKLNQLRVLCAVRQGEQGVHSLNANIEAYLLRHGLISKDTAFYRNRPVMVTRNNYTLGLYNGDVGLLRPDTEGIMKVWFTDNTEGNAGNLKSVLPGFISEMETVYAMTIHKSQGSEFDKVLVVLPKQGNHQMLTRELLYTGITRAKNQVIIQATKEVLLSTSAAMVARGSGVIERLQNV